MAGDTRATAIPADVAAETVAHATRLRRTYQRLAVVVCGLFALSAFLPITETRYRTGILVAAALLLVLVIIWLGAVPASWFGDRPLVTFGLALQPVLVVWLTLTDGIESPYFPYLLLPVLMTVYSPRTRHTIVLSIATALSLIAIAVLGPDVGTGMTVTNRLATEFIEIIVFAAAAAAIGRVLRAARRTSLARAETLATEREDAVRLANTDTLTGLYNRRYADEVLVRLAAEAQRGRPFSVVALDVDGLKRVNDGHGHEAGDRVLKQVAETLRLQLRGADLAIRLGGDEFLALLPGTGDVQGHAVAARLRRAVQTHDWSDVGDDVLISSGVAEWQTGQSGADVVNAADERLYQAKRARPQ